MTSGTELRRWRGAEEGNGGSSVEGKWVEVMVVIKGSASLCNFGLVFVLNRV